MVTGVHAIVFTGDVVKTRGFFRETLGLRSVDAGGGWPIFALPPAELAAHPTDEQPRHELYLMCDDIRRQLACRDPHWTLWSTAVGPPLQTAWRMPPAGTPVTASVTESESLDQPLGLAGALGPV